MCEKSGFDGAEAGKTENFACFQVFLHFSLDTRRLKWLNREVGVRDYLEMDRVDSSIKGDIDEKISSSNCNSGVMLQCLWNPD